MEFICGRPGPHPEFDAPEGLVRGADREGPIFPRTPWPSVGAAYFATLGIAAALRARQVSGQGQRVTTSLLQGALAAASLNWQRVENPDAPLYWMWPIDSRSIEGLYECADGKWVHHWTLRPRWVLAAAEGDTLCAVETDASYRDDPDRVSMEPDGLLTGLFLHEQLTEAFKKFPSDEWVRAAEEAGLGITTVRSPGEALADKSFLADGCVVEVEDPDEGPIHHVGTLLEFSATPGSVAGPAPRSGEHTDEVLRRGRYTIGIRRGLAGATRPSPFGCPRPRPRTWGRWAVHRTCPGRPGCRCHQGQRAARHLLERDAHGPRHEPREAQHRPQPQGPRGPGSPREASPAVGRDHAQLETGSRRRASVSTMRRSASVTPDWSTATPEGTRRGHGPTCPVPTKMPRP